MPGSGSGRSAAANAAESGIKWQVRPYHEKDVPAITALINAANRADRLDKYPTEVDVRQDMATPGLIPEHQVMVVDGHPLDEVPSGTLLGFGRAFPVDHEAGNERIYNVVMRAHPVARGYGLEHVLAKQLIQMALRHEADPATKRMKKVRVRCYLFEKQLSMREAWGQIGLREVRQGWTMLCPLDAPPKPQHVDGVTFRNYSYPEDNERALHAFNSSFADYYDTRPLSEEAWDHQMKASCARPDLSWLADVDDGSGKIAGFAICWVDEGENRKSGRLEGWIEGIGVIPEWRRRGLGRALLLHSLHSLKSAGLESALADVDSQSAGAVHLFESCGFKIQNVLSQYECLLGEVTL